MKQTPMTRIRGSNTLTAAAWSRMHTEAHWFDSMKVGKLREATHMPHYDKTFHLD